MAEHYTQLLEWRRNETAARGLAKLPGDFYRLTDQYLSETRRAYEADLRANPSDRKGELARQTYQRAVQVARDVVEARILKLQSLAFQATIGGAREVPNALPEERSLWESLVRTLESHRRSVAPYLEPTPPPAPVAAAGASSERRSPKLAAVPEASVAPRAGGREARATELVRVLKDRGAIEIGNETVDLRREDVLSVPVETARLLVAAHVAERIDATTSKSSS